MADVGGPWDRIPSQKGRSKGEDIFHSWRTGDMSESDYHTHNAILLSEQLDTYRPKIHMPPHQLVIGYARDRVDGRAEYDQAQARRLGTWFSKTVTDVADNAKDLEMLLWAAKKVAEKGLVKEFERLEEASKRYLGIPVPDQEIELTIRCKALDANARERQKRGV